MRVIKDDDDIAIFQNRVFIFPDAAGSERVGRVRHAGLGLVRLMRFGIRTEIIESVVLLRGVGGGRVVGGGVVVAPRWTGGGWGGGLVQAEGVVYL